jgi:Chaperone of endosialidase
MAGCASRPVLTKWDQPRRETMESGSGKHRRGIAESIRSKGIVLVAALLVLCGTTYAAAALPKNSVGTKQLKNGAVTAKKVKKNGLTGNQINESSLGTVPSAVNADTLDGLHASAFALAGSSAAPSGPAGGALAGSYPNPSLNVSGGPCSDRQALRDITSLAALTCGPGVYAAGSSTAVPGDTALTNNIGGTPGIGEDNSAFGHNALEFNTEGSFNTAVGAYSLQANTTGQGNTATGWSALGNNTTGEGSGNSAFGSAALYSNTSGRANTAVGGNALRENAGGKLNSAFGSAALEKNSGGEKNTALGMKALFGSTGDNNIAIGWAAGSALTTGNNNIYLGSSNGAEESNTIHIGSNQTKAFLAGVFGVTPGGTASPVLVDGSGQLGTTSSSRRFKRDIHPLGSLSAKLMALKPVSFRYKRSFVHGPSSLQFGLIAEQVAKVYPNLVVYGRDGRPSAVAYQELPALLLAQAQKQQRQNNALRAENRRQGAEIKRQQAQINWLMRQARRP